MFRTAAALVTLFAATLPVGAATASAAPDAFGPANVQPSASVGVWDGPCSSDDPPPVALPSTPLVENGPTVTTSTSVSGSITGTGDPTDKLAESAQVATRTSLTSVAGVPRSLTTSYTGSIEVTSAKATSACRISGHAAAHTDVPFTLARPMWVTLTQSRKGPAYSEIYLSTDGEVVYQEDYGTGLDGTSSSTYYLPAGSYLVSVDVAAQKGGRTALARTSVSGTSSVTFAAVGARVSGPTSNAYVALPLARSCTTHTATARLTTSAERLRRVRSVELRVDGRRAALLTGRTLTRGRAVALTLADDRAAAISAVVGLRNGTRVQVAARYLACAS